MEVFFYSSTSFLVFFLSRVVRDRLTVDASVKRPASAPGLGVRARKLSDGIPDDVEEVLGVLSGATQPRLHPPH